MLRDASWSLTMRRVCIHLRQTSKLRQASAADGPLATSEATPKSGGTRDAVPSGISKYSGCSREELLQKILEVRVRTVALEQKRDAILDKSIKVPAEEKLEQEELQGLNRALEHLAEKAAR